MMNGKHRFAFFASLEGSAKKDQQLFSIQDEVLRKRISLIIRMKKGDQLTLFDHEHCADVILEEVSKKSVQYQILSIQKIERQAPEIICLLPLLKRDALEQAISRLSILGVAKIQLVVSEKSRQSLTQKETARLQKMMIAAAEQSKQFAMPELIAPKRLEDSLFDLQCDHAFLFDQYGETSRKILAQKYSQSILLAFGPEGDFTETEKQFFKENNFKSLLLTSSILRTIDAILLGVGLFRLS
jgi:16S rRNA (uracil1498-N3)-methyltransferase